MADSSGWYQRLGPCANCGKEHGAVTASTRLMGGACCSTACCIRLDAKLRSGMIEQEPGDGDYRAATLRFRIAELRGLLRQAGLRTSARVVPEPVDEERAND